MFVTAALAVGSFILLVDVSQRLSMIQYQDIFLYLDPKNIETARSLLSWTYNTLYAFLATISSTVLSAAAMSSAPVSSKASASIGP